MQTSYMIVDYKITDEVSICLSSSYGPITKVKKNNRESPHNINDSNNDNGWRDTL